MQGNRVSPRSYFFEKNSGFQYAMAGASAISCLTEPKWFKGTLDDMKSIRIAIDNMVDRPALLRKDFIVDEYQIYEARGIGTLC